MRIDPQRLLRLAVLIEHGSFRRAAEHLCLTQPALSQSIAQIESEVGVKLIERTPQGVEPTIYGRVLYEHAKVIDGELALASQRLKEIAFGHKGALTCGVTAGAAATLVTSAVCRLLISHPGTQIRLIENTSVDALLAQLHDRSFDMVICQRPNEVALKNTRTVSLFSASRMAWIRADHPLSGAVHLRDLAPYPFVCPPEEMGSLFGLPQIFSAAGLQQPEILVSNSLQMAKEIVLNSDAFALFSDLSVLNERKSGSMRMIELDIPTQYWMQMILRGEQTDTDLMKAFVLEMLEVAKELKIDVHKDAKAFNLRHASR